MKNRIDPWIYLPGLSLTGFLYILVGGITGACFVISGLRTGPCLNKIIHKLYILYIIKVNNW